MIIVNNIKMPVSYGEEDIRKKLINLRLDLYLRINPLASKKKYLINID